MTDIDIAVDTIAGSNSCPPSINLEMHRSLDASGSQSFTFSSKLSLGPRRMTAHKLHDTDRSDIRARELAARLSLEEKVRLTFHSINFLFSISIPLLLLLQFWS
jgi:hypothetical protein